MDVLVQALSFAITFVAGPVPSVLSAINAASSALNRGGRLLRVFAKILRAIARVIQQIDDVIEGLAGKVSDAIRGSLRGSSKKLSRTVDRLSKKIDAGDADIDDVVRDTVDIGDELSDVVIALCLGVRPRGHACFPAGTLVTTSQGLLPIEQIQRGMHVLGRDAVTGEWGYGEVEIAFERSYSGDLVSLQIGGEKIDCTPGHPFWVSAGEGLYDRPAAEDYDPALSVVPGSAVSGRWVLANDLRPGDVVISHERGELTIDAINHTSSRTTVYNFHVTGQQSYVVGRVGVWVHNNSADPKRGVDCTGDVLPDLPETDHFEEISRFRQRARLPDFDANVSETGTVARAVLDDDSERAYHGVNSGLSQNSIPDRMEVVAQLQEKGYFKNVTNIGQAPMLAHAEAHALMRAVERTGAKSITIYVDRTLCGACRRQLGLLADHLGVTELRIFEFGNPSAIPIRPRA